MTQVQLKYLGFAVLLSLLWTVALYGVYTFVSSAPDPSTWHPLVRLMFLVMWFFGAVPIYIDVVTTYTQHEANR